MLLIPLLAVLTQTAAGKPIESLPPLSAPLVSAISPDQSRIALETRKDGVLVVDIASGRLCSRIQPAEAGAVVIAWSPDSVQLALLQTDGVVAIAQAVTGLVTQRIRTRAPGGYIDVRGEIGFGADGKVLLRSAGAFGMQIWDISTAHFVAQVPPSQKEFITAVAFQRDGDSFALGDSGGKVSVWRSADGARTADLGPFDRPHTSFAIGTLDFDASGDQLAIGNGSPCVRVWNWAESGDVREFLHAESLWSGEGQHIGCVRFSRDGEKLLSTTFPEFEARVWDLATEQSTLVLDYGGGSTTAIQGWISHDGSYASMFSGWPVKRVVAREARAPSDRRPDQAAPVFESDGDYAWAVVDRHFVVRKIPDGEPITRLPVRDE